MGGGGGLAAFLVPRVVLFRFGNWVYGGEVDFPVEQLRLGDVPYVLPALQKQQGRLDYIADAKALPARYALTPTLQQFMAATAILKAEMEDSQVRCHVCGVGVWACGWVFFIHFLTPLPLPLFFFADGACAAGGRGCQLLD